MPRSRDLSDRENQPAAELAGIFDSDGHVVSNTKIAGKAELFRLLKRWLQVSGAPTIGRIGTFGQRPCIFIALQEGLTAVLNVDTKREAVEQFVEDADARGSDVPWSAIPNRRGRVNKLAFRADGTETPGWYCYLREPLLAAVKI